MRTRSTALLFVVTALTTVAFVACEKKSTADEDPTLEVPESVAIHGHRGARGLRPENTLPSLEVALDLEVDVLEFDLHLTKDGEVVVWHDPYVSAQVCRLSQPRELAGARPPVDESPYPLRAEAVDPDGLTPLHPALAVRNQRADQLRKLKCDRNPDPIRFPEQQPDPTLLAGDDYGIVTLGEVFAFVKRYQASEEKSESQRANAAEVQFNIETKRSEEYPTFIGDGFDGENPGAFERAVYAAVKSAGMLDRTIVQSFDHRSLWAMRKLDESLTLSALEKESKTKRGTREHAKVALEEWHKKGAAFWSSDHDLITAESVKEAKAAGLKLAPWTVNDRAEMKRLVGLGVDAIITDRPDLVSHPDGD